MPALAHTKPTPEVVLAKALLRAAEQLGLSQSDLAEVLGVHRTTITQLKKTGGSTQTPSRANSPCCSFAWLEHCSLLPVVIKSGFSILCVRLTVSLAAYQRNR